MITKSVLDDREVIEALMKTMLRNVCVDHGEEEAIGGEIEEGEIVSEERCESTPISEKSAGDNLMIDDELTVHETGGEPEPEESSALLDFEQNTAARNIASSSNREEEDECPILPVEEDDDVVVLAVNNKVSLLFIVIRVDSEHRTIVQCVNNVNERIECRYKERLRSSASRRWTIANHRCRSEADVQQFCSVEQRWRRDYLRWTGQVCSSAISAQKLVHCSSVTGSTTRRIAKFPCTFCSHSFLTHGSLKAHERTHAYDAGSTMAEVI